MDIALTFLIVNTTILLFIIIFQARRIKHLIRFVRMYKDKAMYHDVVLELYKKERRKKSLVGDLESLAN